MVTFSINKGMATMNDESDETLVELVMDLLHSSIVAQIMHWQTESYAAHKALGDFYETMPGMLDSLIEAYQGKNNIILAKFPMGEETYEGMAPLAYMEKLLKEMDEGRALFGTDPEVQNLVDNVAGLIDSTIYKLRRFK